MHEHGQLNTWLEEFLTYGRVRVQSPLSETTLLHLAAAGLRPSEVYHVGPRSLEELDLMLAYERAWEKKLQAEAAARAAVVEAKREALASALAEMFP